MNILFISPNSPGESTGGVERFISNLISYGVDKTDLNIHILLPTTKEETIETKGRVTIHHVNNLSLVNPTSTRQKEISTKVRQFASTVEMLLKEHSIEIVCAENFHLGLPAAYSILLNMVAGTYNIPIVLRLHSFAIKDLQTELINQLLWKKISCVSKSVAGDCFHKGANIDYLSTDYLGVNTQDFNATSTPKFDLKERLQLPADSQILLSATRIVQGSKNILQKKGLINLIGAFSKISPRYEKLRLVIGVGKTTNNLKNEFNTAYNMLLGYIQLHNIADKTIVKTFELPEMSSVYRGADIFILPSENETFGQVFIESMACGVAVIATNVGGIPEIISDSYNGYLVPVGNTSVLSQRIENLLIDTELRNKFIQAGLKTVENNFTSEKQFGNFFEMLKKVATIA
ncbi:N-acetyl-alpha-D-glucosaminyl L-malate synthase BshA [soil metagenome]